jgi:hypothetical protein
MWKKNNYSNKNIDNWQWQKDIYCKLSVISCQCIVHVMSKLGPNLYTKKILIGFEYLFHIQNNSLDQTSLHFLRKRCKLWFTINKTNENLLVDPPTFLNGRNVPYFFINPKSKNGHHWWTILKHGTPYVLNPLNHLTVDLAEMQLC